MSNSSNILATARGACLLRGNLWRRGLLIAGPSLIAVGLSACLFAEDAHHAKTKIVYASGIPTRDYKYQGESPHKFAISSLGIPMRVVDNDDKKLKGYQARRGKSFAIDSIEVKPCTVSQCAFFIQEDGYWSLNLHGDQNADLGNRPSPPFVAPVPTGQFSEFIIRNQFYVRVQGLGLAQLTDGDKNLITATPGLFRIDAAPFWVQRGTPALIRQSGFSPEVSRFFDQIDRVEVEFFFK